MIDYSITIVLYNIFINLLVPYALANAARLGLTTAQTDQLTALLTRWNLAYPAYISPTNYGKLTVATINSTYRACKTVTDGLTQLLKIKGTTALITLLDLDYIIFDIHKDSAKKKQVIPTEQAGVVLKLTTHLNNFFKVINIGDPSNGAKPKGVKRITIVMLVLDALAPAPTIDKLLPEMTSGSMNFDIPFTPDQIGMIAYIAVCFSNDKGDASFSAIIACRII